MTKAALPEFTPHPLSAAWIRSFTAKLHAVALQQGKLELADRIARNATELDELELMAYGGGTVEGLLCWLLTDHRE